MATKKQNKLGLGMLLGAAAGAVAGLFLAPKAGKELRKDAENLTRDVAKKASKYTKKLEKKTPEQIANIVFGDVSEASMSMAKRAHKELTAELADLEKRYKTVDKKKYAGAVKSVVANLKKDGEVPAATLKKLAIYLEHDARKLAGLKRAGAKSSKAATKRTTTRTSATKRSVGRPRKTA